MNFKTIIEVFIYVGNVIQFILCVLLIVSMTYSSMDNTLEFKPVIRFAQFSLIIMFIIGLIHYLFCFEARSLQGEQLRASQDIHWLLSWIGFIYPLLFQGFIILIRNLFCYYFFIDHNCGLTQNILQ